MAERISHEFAPVFDARSRILILGTMPSVKSREQHFYYMHPQNRFWRVLSQLLAWEFPQSISDKKAMLLQNRIAVWDVIASCEITGSSDSSIRQPEVNDFSALFETTEIRQVFTNGKKADALYRKHSPFATAHPPLCLPSTSPANAAFGMERLLAEWKVILQYTEEQQNECPTEF